MTKFLLNDFIVEKHVKEALEEDIGYGDITTDFLCEGEQKLSINFVTRADGIFCGEVPFKMVFKILADDEVKIKFLKKDGDMMKKGDILAKVEGPARAILTGERLALNYAQKMSAISTLTRKYADKLRGSKAKISDTRKNTPNFRLFEKYAMLIGGGSLHRFNLCDCVMLKDNHIALCGGSMKKAIAKMKQYLSHTHKLEVECDTIEQVKCCVSEGVDIIMLDNMAPEVRLASINIIRNTKKPIIIEVSGGVNLDTVEEIGKDDVDIISTSALINAPMLDLAFDYKN